MKYRLHLLFEFASFRRSQKYNSRKDEKQKSQESTLTFLLFSLLLSKKKKAMINVSSI